jgi:cysteine-rich repeat protein
MRFHSFFAFLIGLLLGVGSPALAATSWFPDVDPRAFFQPSVERMTAIGVLKGYDDGLFGPRDAVTRGQMAVVMDRYDEQVIDPLREQVQAMRRELDMGYCGDDIVQLGEECDDGQTADGDGCSGECLREEAFIAPPPAGGAEGEKCFSSDDCSDGQSCSTERGDCRSACEPGAEACIQACAGVCETDDDGATQTACEAERETFDQVIASNKSCRSDSDCTVFIASCPFVTCGVAIDADAQDEAQRAVQRYNSCPDRATAPLACAMCAPMEAACEAGTCVARNVR